MKLLSYIILIAGLERLPLAFRPFLGERVKFGRRIEKAEYLAEENKIKFSWRENFKQKTFNEEVFDYALVAVPFTQVRRWRLPSEHVQLFRTLNLLLTVLEFSSLLGRAIDKLEYGTACKVSLDPSSTLVKRQGQGKRTNLSTGCPPV